MRRNVFMLTLAAVVLLMSSCASKKDLLNCQTENRQLMGNYQEAKEQLAASTARVQSLEEQLAQAKRDYARLQKSLDKSLSNASQNNVSIEKLVDHRVDGLTVGLFDLRLRHDLSPGPGQLVQDHFADFDVVRHLQGLHEP